MHLYRKSVNELALLNSESHLLIFLWANLHLLGHCKWSLIYSNLEIRYWIFNGEINSIIFALEKVWEKMSSSIDNIGFSFPFDSIQNFWIISLLEPGILLKIKRLLLYALRKRLGYFFIPISAYRLHIIFQPSLCLSFMLIGLT